MKKRRPLFKHSTHRICDRDSTLTTLYFGARRRSDWLGGLGIAAFILLSPAISTQSRTHAHDSGDTASPSALALHKRLVAAVDHTELDWALDAINELREMNVDVKELQEQVGLPLIWHLLPPNDADWPEVRRLVACLIHLDAIDIEAELFEYGAPVIAAAHWDAELMWQLLQAGADINARGRHGRTILSQYSVSQSDESGRMSHFHQQGLSALVQLGADPNAADERGMTPLMVAASAGAVDASWVLMEQGARVDLKDHSGNSALMWAASTTERSSLIQLLLNAGATVDMQNDNGETPLMRAAETLQLETIELLLQHGANPDLTNSKGQTASTIARRSVLIDPNDEELVELQRRVIQVLNEAESNRANKD